MNSFGPFGLSFGVQLFNVDIIISNNFDMVAWSIYSEVAKFVSMMSVFV